MTRFLSPSPLNTGSSPSSTLASPLHHNSTNDAFNYIRTQASSVKLRALRNSLLQPSANSSFPASERGVDQYAASRGAPDPLGMRDANQQSLQLGQVWRLAAITVTPALLDVHDPDRIPRRVYQPMPSVLKPHCAVVWRDIYDVHMSCTDRISVQTVLEMGAAARTAYNWLNNRHRSVISANAQAYIEKVLEVLKTGSPIQYEACAINTVPLCVHSTPVAANSDPNWKVSKQWANLIILEYLKQTNPSSVPRNVSYNEEGEMERVVEIVMDHYSQMALLHARGHWGGDIDIDGQARRRSEVLNFVPHGTVVVTFDEIRTCPCCVDDITTELVQVKVHRKAVLQSNRVLSTPGLVHFASGHFIFALYVVLLMISLVVVTALSVMASESRFDTLTSVLEGWTWSVALVSALHLIVVKNIFPGIEIRDLAMGQRRALNLEDMNLSKETLICLAQDARTNHLLAQGNACAYANRPSGTVQVSSMPTAREAWNPGLIVTDTFAIKLQQETPLIRRVVKNLDGSIHIDWEEVVRESIAGRLLKYEVKVGKSRKEMS